LIRLVKGFLCGNIRVKNRGNLWVFAIKLFIQLPKKWYFDDDALIYVGEFEMGGVLRFLSQAHTLRKNSVVDFSPL
jgi:hypothetical protein